MNLASALGVIAWQDRRVAHEKTGSQLSPTSAQRSSELWCMAPDLESFWEDDMDARWSLLTAIALSAGYGVEQLLPCDMVEDKPVGVSGIAFGMMAEGLIVLPALDDMLSEPKLKKQAWQILCEHALVQ